jgi:hypothetical protein
MNIEMMKGIIKTVKRYIAKEEEKVLGRWKIEKCSKKMNSKVDMANEDHCGPCGEYANRRSETYKEETNHNKKNK